ncbi:inheritance of peroxisomes protein 1-domain-containing protein [Scheffersomyces coipomensis]|uniref:inheritance of peroxisomes protein 1-domain-containing protein n=1 Tax=Scheffersomyces coipomensis TaxID=1788519 RepID=UPI00315D8B3F
MSSSRNGVHHDGGQILSSPLMNASILPHQLQHHQQSQQVEESSKSDQNHITPVNAKSISKRKKRKQKSKNKSQSFNQKEKEVVVVQTTEIPHDQKQSISITEEPVIQTKHEVVDENIPIIQEIPTPQIHIIKDKPTSDNHHKVHNDILQPPFQIKSTGLRQTLSPRKQTLMRHKQSEEDLNYINELKGTLKSNKTSPSFSPPVNSTSQSLSTNTNLNMDEKVTLFKYKSSKILVYDDDDSSSYNSNNSGSLLSFGELEIFQLHKGDITYISCGSSFIYPLLPKLKILRINFNQFILPLINPERYWKIIINSDEPNVIQVLENTFERIVKYRNLYIKGTTADIKHEIKAHTPIEETTTIPKIIKTKDPIRSTPNDFQFPIISNEIPDSPPSAPLSPHNNGLEYAPISPIKPPAPPHTTHHQLNKKASSQSITTVMACLDVNPLPLSPTGKSLFQPKPKKMAHTNANPYQLNRLNEHDDDKSDSSMDSLLDEYEENITKTKSITFTRSRPPTRPQSMASSIKYSSVNYSRVYPNNNELEEFPSTSLSEYNRIHNSGGGGGGAVRSRRSSRSELYTSETNWMEPNFDFQSQTNISVNTPNGNNNINTTNPRIITKSKSNYSINSNSQASLSLGHSQSQPQFDLNKTYRNIYKSIAQRNLKAGLEDDSNHRLPTITANVQSDFRGSSSSQLSSSQQKRDRLYPNSTTNIDQSQNTYKLGSSEIYQLISKKENLHNARIPPQKHISTTNTTNITNSSRTPSAGNTIPRSTSFTSRLFGW